jgi:hypothetical protein
MIHEIGKELATALLARGAPFRVADPERTDPIGTARERVVLEEVDGGDTFGPVVSQHRNPRCVMTCTIAARLRIFAQDTRAGATSPDHQRRARAVLDQVLVALKNIMQARKAPSWLPDRGGFAPIEDAAGTLAGSRSGALYELFFTVPRAVLDAPWTGTGELGAAAAEVEFGGADGVVIGSTTGVLLANGPDGATADTACGG